MIILAPCLTSKSLLVTLALVSPSVNESNLALCFDFSIFAEQQESGKTLLKTDEKESGGSTPENRRDTCTQMLVFCDLIQTLQTQCKTVLREGGTMGLCNDLNVIQMSEGRLKGGERAPHRLHLTCVRLYRRSAS